MTNNQTFKAAGGEDLLSYIPHAVGYWPQQSVVFIGMAGKKIRATLRMDLPQDDAGDLAFYIRTSVNHLRSDPLADGCLVALYSDQEWTRPLQNPHGRLMSALSGEFAAAGLPVKEAWHVGPAHWRSVDCVDGNCCGWPGRDLREITDSRLNTELVFRGSTYGRGPADAVAASVALRNRHEAERVEALLHPLAAQLCLNGLQERQLRTTLAAWDHAISRWPDNPNHHWSAFLLASLQRVGVRDAIMVSMASSVGIALGGAVGLELVEESGAEPVGPDGWNAGGFELMRMAGESVRDDVDTVRDFSAILMGGLAHGEDLGTLIGASGSPGSSGGSGASDASDKSRRSRPFPNWDRMEKAAGLLLHLAGATDGPEQAPVLCILGWIQWCKGRGSSAGAYFALAQHRVDGYRLAQLLDELMAHGCVSAWARDPLTAWHADRDASQWDSDEGDCGGAGAEDVA